MQGRKLPDITFKTRVRDPEVGGDNPFRWQDVTTADVFAGKRVVVFSLPGAFTPTCSARHLPGYTEHAAALKAKGVDTVACVSVNDVFVMSAWGKAQNVGDDVLMLADGNAAFTKALGLEMDGSKFGMGTRSQRYAMVVKDGVVETLNVEAPGEFKVSAADYVLGQL